MRLITQAPKRTLNKAFLKQRPLRSKMDLFKAELTILLGRIDTNETEEFHKNLVSDFLKKAIYHDNNFINTKGRQDLVIHNGKDNKTQVGVIIEAKRPNNKGDWFTADKPNGKAIHELVLYYLRERIECNNIDIKYLVATNINEWYIIEAKYFENLFYKNKVFVKHYEEWRDGKKVTKDTGLFYNEIVKPFIDQLDEEISCTYFNIQNYVKVLKNEDKEDDKNLIALLKILSPQHLLKISFANDSNELDDKFYRELLHIIGLEEAKENRKNIIRRKVENKNPASLLEMAFKKLRTKGIHKIVDIKIFGETSDEQYFNIALELCITWINRILFLKLLEGQLISYHKGDRSYRFLNLAFVHDFDELFKLFHNVLAVNITSREQEIKNKYKLVPYLNSSLFEISELEDLTICIDSLDNSETLDFNNTSILKEQKKKSDKLKTLDYLFLFLDSYDFASEGSENIQEDNKPLINASVLGKVFEKINGYKDGSIYTPGFITMYMCRHSIRLAVVQKFNEAKNWNLKSFEEIYNKIDDITEANKIINDIKICDPAVGSGHFLVSALNEIIAVKSELKILSDTKGKRLKEYTVEVENDELYVTDEEGEIFDYKPQNKESQRIQETLFLEKQTIIENCLFGVDINPNSVKICRLRLWIELLKNAYYKTDTDYTELETLPNIDINIKCGNTLLSRFALDADLAKALKSIKYDIKAYRGFVNDYKSEKNSNTKRGLQKIIDGIKSDFRTEIANNDPKKIRLSKLSKELFLLLSVQNSPIQADVVKGGVKKEREKKVKLESEITKLSTEIDEIKNNSIYKTAFEWRFEFPEVLSNAGEFEGFDLVIGNPPYFSLSKIKEQGNYLKNAGYVTYSKGADIYCLFYERGNQVLKSNGLLIYITSNSWLKTIYGEPLKKYFTEKMQPLELLNIEDTQVFSEATVESNIIFLQKGNNMKEFMVCNMSEDYSIGSSLSEYFTNNSYQFDIKKTPDWIIGNEATASLKNKIEQGSKLLKHFDITINFGIKTGYNDAFIIDEEIRKNLISDSINNAKIIKPIIRGRDLKRYTYEFSKLWIIFIPKGFTIKKNLPVDDVNYLAEPIPRYGNMEFDPAWDWFKEKYPAVASYLLPYKTKAEERQDKGDYWWEQRACSYLDDFEKPKIIWGEISDKAKFAFDELGYYAEATSFLMTGKNLKYLLSILNSKVSEWYFNQISTTTGMGTNRWKKYKIELLPIKDISDKDQEPFITLVDQILEAKQQGKDSTVPEKKIDELVYKLYEITEDEQKIIEEK